MRDYSLLITTLIAITLVPLWIAKSKKKSQSDESKRFKPKSVNSDGEPLNQTEIVLSHIEIYGSICRDEAMTLYGIKNLKAVIHKIRSKMKVEVINIYHTGTNRFYGYGIKEK